MEIRTPSFCAFIAGRYKQGLKIAICSEVYRAEIQILHRNTARMWIFIAKNRNFELIQPLTDVESVITSTYLTLYFELWPGNQI